MNPGKQKPPADMLSQKIGVLARREVEARILTPLITAMAARFDQKEVERILRRTIVEIARKQGEEMADDVGGNSSHHLLQALQYWSLDNAVEIDFLLHENGNLHFNITRCRYAEMYREMGIPELGEILSCNRDHAMIQGFNPRASLVRTQTILQGAAFCDFRYAF